MSEEILKALTQLFAIISKQDGGVSETERGFVIKFFQQELDTQTVQEYVDLYDKFADYGTDAKEDGDEELKKDKKKLTNVKDSVRTLAICRKINKTLNQKQKVIVLVKLLELLASDQAFTPQRMEIINTVSTVFNIPPHEYKLIEAFVVEPSSDKLLEYDDILVFDEERPPAGSKVLFIDSGLLDGEIIFVRSKSVGLYFMKYTGLDDIYLNGKPVYKDSIIQFSPGSVVKTPKGSPLYYSDLVSKYNSDVKAESLSFSVSDVEFRFPNGAIGLRNINLSESEGKLIGIMGASGAGKTTLLNVMAGLETPFKGSVKINGHDVHLEKDKIKGTIGYIAQDDLLIEELTVYQNLYYNAKLCFKGLTDSELHEKVMAVLSSLGLDRIADLKVGNVLNKKISGGQRKRLNIALELIREPAVMFVDEPTSGLSSRDSENVIDLLKELSLKGKLIFVVIHQPSSDIYKMFDKIWLMDNGGYSVFYGNPIEAVTYFKHASGQVSSERGQCPTCGNVNPEQLFNIIEARVVDEYGEFTNKRKVTPIEWHKLFLEKINIDKVQEVEQAPPTTLNIPGRIMQAVIFSTRDFLSKVSNTQYMVINLIEAPLLALLLSLVIRYRENETGIYLFRENDNVPAYILICIIIALFMGLTVSAEEIIKDRKILRREAFLNLSRSSYLFSKIIILFLFSAIQTLSFVLIGNFILGVKGLDIEYWIVLFTVSCHANVLGLNVSSGFNSAVTVYILIPILLIPQMILSGIIFDFSKLNNSISEKGKVPVLADFMASRWAYEALGVTQFKDNAYEKNIFEYDMAMSVNNYRSAYWKPKLEEILLEASELSKESLNDSTKQLLNSHMALLKHELSKDRYFQAQKAALLRELESASSISDEDFEKLYEALADASNFYSMGYVHASESKDSVLYLMSQVLPEGMELADLRDQYFNEDLQDLVRNNSSTDKIIVHNGRLIQLADPIYHIPSEDRSPLDYRTHFFAPYKRFAGTYFGTYLFNICTIWFMTLILCLTLYFEVVGKIIRLMGAIPFPKLKKS